MNEPSKTVFTYSGIENLEAMKQARNYNQFLIDLVRRNLVGVNMLDFGAGAGTFALPLRQAGVSVACVEPDSGLRKNLSASGFETYPDIRHVARCSFDCVYTLNVLEHVEDDRAALAAIYQAIRPGGRVIIYVPAFDILFGEMDRLVGHHRRYRRKDLREKVDAAGFQINTATYIDSLGFFLALAYRWVGDETGSISPGSVKVYDRFVFPLSRLVDRLMFGSFGKNLLVVGTRS